MTDASERLTDLVRDEGRRVLATLVRTVGDLTVAEDAVSDAGLAALRRWPVDGVPDNPRAWLTTVARNAALDTLRRASRTPTGAMSWRCTRLCCASRTRPSYD